MATNTYPGFTARLSIAMSVMEYQEYPLDN